MYIAHGPLGLVPNTLLWGGFWARYIVIFEQMHHLRGSQGERKPSRVLSDFARLQQRKYSYNPIIIIVFIVHSLSLYKPLDLDFVLRVPFVVSLTFYAKIHLSRDFDPLANIINLGIQVNVHQAVLPGTYSNRRSHCELRLPRPFMSEHLTALKQRYGHLRPGGRKLSILHNWTRHAAEWYRWYIEPVANDRR